MASVLRGLRILEISSVDKAAGVGTKVVLLKRADETEPERLARAARAARDERLRREREIRRLSDADGDETSKSTIEKIGAAIDGSMITKAEASEALDAMAARNRQPGESLAQSFSRCFTGAAPRVAGGPALLTKVLRMAAGAPVGEIGKRATMDDTAAVQKALGDWNTEVERTMRDEALTRSAAIDAVNKRRPELWSIAKAASGNPSSNMSRATPSAQPRRVDGQPDADHAAAWDAAVAAIMRMRPTLTKSQAVDMAMRDSGARAHLEASKRQSQTVNG